MPDLDFVLIKNSPNKVWINLRQAQSVQYKEFVDRKYNTSSIQMTIQMADGTEWDVEASESARVLREITKRTNTGR